MTESLPRLIACFNRSRCARIAFARTTAQGVIALGALLLTAASPAQAQGRASTDRSRTVVIPESSHVYASDLGKAAHTNVRFIATGAVSPSEAPPAAGYGYETPASLACIYHVVAPIPGCNPNETTNTPSGGSQSIAIVDAFDDPTAAADLAGFSAQFGLPLGPGKFQVVYAGGAEPPLDPTGGWEVEESIDIEYSHAMAPNATLYLVEANSNQDSDLYPAVLVASNLVACGKPTACPAHSKGKGEVSMSWGGEEFAQEAELDGFFATPGVVYVASSGDDPGVTYPCASPNVVCAGGTSTARSEYTGNLIGEITWQDAGGGISFYEPEPGYQARLRRQLGGYRGVPDLAADSNTTTGAWILDTNAVPGPGWYIGGGTSLAAPTVAGIVNAAGNFAASSAAELTELYGEGGFGRFNDITYGACGFYSGTFAGFGWDQCTGLGSPRGLGER
jgi:subtilase family serine protease